MHRSGGNRCQPRTRIAVVLRRVVLSSRARPSHFGTTPRGTPGTVPARRCSFGGGALRDVTRIETPKAIAVILTPLAVREAGSSLRG